MKTIAIFAVLGLIGLAMADDTAGTTRPSATMPIEIPPNLRHAMVISAVYVCDGSDAVDAGTAEAIQIELRKAVSHLAPVQFFNILVFQKSDDDTGFISLGSRLLIANPKNKGQGEAFSDSIKFQGPSDPIPALEEAFKECPQLIYFLITKPPRDPSIKAVGDKIAELNKDHKVHVNTILLLHSKAEVEKDKEYQDALKQIASDNGGLFAVYTAEEFNASNSPGTATMPDPK